MAENRFTYVIRCPLKGVCHGKEGGRFVMRKTIIPAVVVLALVSSWPTLSEGAGFALIQQGTAAMAQGNAFVAEADDPSAIYYNPAGLNQLKKPQLYVATFLNRPDRQFHGSDGDFSVTRPRFYESASFFLVFPANDRVALGLGYFSPFGMGTDWPASWTGRYITTYSRLKTYNVNPVISLKLMDNLSVAAGVDLLWSDVRLRRNTPLLPLVDGKSDLSGVGNGIGANFGLLYEPLQGVKFGLSYRSQVFVHHSGELQLSVPAFVRGVPRNVDGSADIVYPPSLTFGVCVNRFSPFTFDFDATWTGWSTYDGLELKLSRFVPLSGYPLNSIFFEKNWHDVWALRFGANWQMKDNIKLRAGYTFDMTPVPNSTLEPQVPDSNRHVFAVGGDLKIKRLTLGIAYNFILNEPRFKDNTFTINGLPLPNEFQVNGKYQSTTHTLGLSSRLEF
uniref:Membrane protein involved in aromatic hydrocarbon degradation n=1 Tax=Desulfobacca acetoxidans TaxID=60893 RepID=A0A7V6DNJ2_9BACT